MTTTSSGLISLFKQHGYLQADCPLCGKPSIKLKQGNMVSCFKCGVNGSGVTANGTRYTINRSVYSIEGE